MLLLRLLLLLMMMMMMVVVLQLHNHPKSIEFKLKDQLQKEKYTRKGLVELECILYKECKTDCTIIP